ncbi:MAG: nucleoside triphosphate pyrophosphohydrolase [Treponema sp.]|jgi:tetrapyrrole methylase family protein/MazG family protein|nr:nucleoside triphosphate pyrophosphohydrolase [Treponema sp.]
MLNQTSLNEAAAFKGLYDIVVRLRAPDGCPWDREQTPASLRGDLIEETYECVEAIDQKDPPHVREELGDIFLLATMLSYMHEQEGLFSVSDVLSQVSEKLIRRHPHVFGELTGKDRAGAEDPARALTSAEVLTNWARIKVEQEGREPKDSLLDEVSRGLPPLDRAWQLQKKAAKAGFDWPDLPGVLGKIGEELEEAREAIQDGQRERIEAELGDLLFSVVNLCRFLKVEPSLALRRTNSKFTGRFKYMEKRMKETGQELKGENLALMDSFWEEAKKQVP